MKYILLFFLLIFFYSSDAQKITKTISKIQIGNLNCSYYKYIEEDESSHYTIYITFDITNSKNLLKSEYKSVHFSNQSTKMKLESDLNKMIGFIGSNDEVRFENKDYYLVYQSFDKSKASICSNSKKFLDDGCVSVSKEDINKLISWLKSIEFPE